jgi:hypothetical protein
MGEPGAHQPPTVACPQLFQIVGCRNSFTEHFCYEENNDGSANASSEKEIQDGVTSGG